MASSLGTARASSARRDRNEKSHHRGVRVSGRRHAGAGWAGKDPTHDFKLGGWVVLVDEMLGLPFDLLLGRRTYQIFAAHWSYAEGGDDDFIAK